MGFFRQQRAIDRLEDRLAALSSNVDDLQRGARKLDLEFTELYDKVRHQMSRMAKRDAVARKAPQVDEEVLIDPPTGIGQDPISQSIMMRRIGGSNGQ